MPEQARVSIYGTTSDDTKQFAIIGAVSRLGVGAVWVYQGLVPKLVLHHPDELAMLTDAGVPPATAALTATIVGWMEIAMGLATIVFSNRWLLVATVLLMIGAAFGVAFSSPRYLGAAFNPVSLNLLMAALALVGIVVGGRAPSAGRCKRHPSEGKA